MPNCNESRVEKGGFGQTESKLCKYFKFQKFLRASRGIVSKTVLVESEENNSD